VSGVVTAHLLEIFAQAQGKHENSAREHHHAGNQDDNDQGSKHRMPRFCCFPQYSADGRAVANDAKERQGVLMPRIVVTSDLHLGITSEQVLRGLASDIALEQPDLTVLAGDIGEGLGNFVACLQLFADLPGQVAVLAGNHDLWVRDGHSSEDLWQHHLPEAVRAAGMLWLEDAVWQQDGGAVVGSIAWYDYSAADPTLPPYPEEFFAAEKRNYNLDARMMQWSRTDVEFAAQVGDALCGRLAQLEQDDAVQGVVVVTHVPLFDVQMLRKPHDRRWGLSNAYFGNLRLGQRLLGLRKLRAVVSGHTHVGRKGQVARPLLPDLPALPVSVLPSDYDAPAYEVVTLGAA
jgi:predicted phosphohydrolase